jgi:hypothetical protein
MKTETKPDAVAGPLEAPVSPAVGDYVLATKYNDGDPGDAWALGFYDGKLPEPVVAGIVLPAAISPRYVVRDAAGNSIRPNGFRRVARIRKDVGAWLLNVSAKQLEQCPPGTVNLWTMLTPAAFDVSDEQG